MEYGYEGKKNRNKEYQGEKRGIWDNGFIAIPKYLVTNFLQHNFQEICREWYIFEKYAANGQFKKEILQNVKVYIFFFKF